MTMPILQNPLAVDTRCLCIHCFFFLGGGGAQVRRHMIEPSPLTERGLAQDKDLSARKSDLFPQSKKPHRYCKDHKNE